MAPALVKLGANLADGMIAAQVALSVSNSAISSSGMFALHYACCLCERMNEAYTLAGIPDERQWKTSGAGYECTFP
ncbi:MAG TPA: hypothetical protein V6D50_04315 [Chroococcales cyanobacterium]